MLTHNHPGTNAVDYASSQARRELQWIPKHAIPDVDEPFVKGTQTDPGAHVELLNEFLKVVPHILDVDQDLLCPRLWHPDLRTWNIFVKDDHITSIVDWQSIEIAPLFLQATRPELVNHQGAVLTEVPDNLRTLNAVQASKVDDSFRSTPLGAYNEETEKQNPTVNRIVNRADLMLRRRPIAFSSDTWENEGFLSLVQALRNIEK